MKPQLQFQLREPENLQGGLKENRVVGDTYYHCKLAGVEDVMSPKLPRKEQEAHADVIGSISKLEIGSQPSVQLPTLQLEIVACHISGSCIRLLVPQTRASQS
jgi:hypothetical protein